MKFARVRKVEQEKIVFQWTLWNQQNLPLNWEIWKFAVILNLNQQQHDFLMKTYSQFGFVSKCEFFNQFSFFFHAAHKFDTGDSRGNEPNSFIQDRGEEVSELF